MAGAEERFFLFKAARYADVADALRTRCWRMPLRAKGPQPHEAMAATLARGGQVRALLSASGSGRVQALVRVASVGAAAADADGFGPPLALVCERAFPVSEDGRFGSAGLLLAEAGPPLAQARNGQEIPPEAARASLAKFERALAEFELGQQQRKPRGRRRQGRQAPLGELAFASASEEPAACWAAAEAALQAQWSGAELLLAGLGGSRRFGLQVAGSDCDLYGVFAAAARDAMGLGELPRTLKNARGAKPDLTLVELRAFCAQLLEGVPQAVEALCLADAAVLRAAPHWAPLRRAARCFVGARLARKYLSDASGAQGLAKLARLRVASDGGDASEVNKTWYIVLRQLLLAQRVVDAAPALRDFAPWFGEEGPERQLLLDARAGRVPAPELRRRAEAIAAHVQRRLREGPWWPARAAARHFLEHVLLEARARALAIAPPLRSPLEALFAAVAALNPGAAPALVARDPFRRGRAVAVFALPPKLLARRRVEALARAVAQGGGEVRASPFAVNEGVGGGYELTELRAFLQAAAAGEPQPCEALLCDAPVDYCAADIDALRARLAAEPSLWGATYASRAIGQSFGRVRALKDGQGDAAESAAVARAAAWRLRGVRALTGGASPSEALRQDTAAAAASEAPDALLREVATLDEKALRAAVKAALAPRPSEAAAAAMDELLVARARVGLRSEEAAEAAEAEEEGEGEREGEEEKKKEEKEEEEEEASKDGAHCDAEAELQLETLLRELRVPLRAQQVLFAAAAGSFLYDLNTATSDRDYFFVFAADTAEAAGLRGARALLESHAEAQPDKSGVAEYSALEAEAFADALLKGNPKYLEALFADRVLLVRPLFARLYAHRGRMLSDRCLAQYAGFVKDRLRSLSRADTAAKQGKLLYHAFHKLFDAERIAHGEAPLVRAVGAERDFVLRCRGDARAAHVPGDFTAAALVPIVEARLERLRALRRGGAADAVAVPAHPGLPAERVRGARADASWGPSGRPAEADWTALAQWLAEVRAAALH